MNEDDVPDDVCARLDGLGIPYALTGGLAVSYYGRPRATHDADIVVAIARAAGLHANVQEIGNVLWRNMENVAPESTRAL